MPVRYGYRRFGDDDDFDDLDVEELLSHLADDFMESGDLDEAMDRLLREGYTNDDGERVEGLRELLNRRVADAASSSNRPTPRARCSAIATGSRHRSDEERRTRRAAAEAEASDDERRQEVTRDLVDQKKMQRELMSDRLAERLGEYHDYDFVSSKRAKSSKR